MPFATCSEAVCCCQRAMTFCKATGLRSGASERDWQGVGFCFGPKNEDIKGFVFRDVLMLVKWFLKWFRRDGILTRSISCFWCGFSIDFSSMPSLPVLAPQKPYVFSPSPHLEEVALLEVSHHGLRILGKKRHQRSEEERTMTGILKRTLKPKHHGFVGILKPYFFWGPQKLTKNHKHHEAIGALKILDS